MREIGRGDRIFLVLSEKYWFSRFCMFELWETWRNAKLEAEEFRTRIRAFAHPSARLSDDAFFNRVMDHWEDECARLKALRVKRLSADDLYLMQVLGFLVVALPEIRAAIRDTVREKDPGRYVEWALGDLA
jgi:internalin A